MMPINEPNFSSNERKEFCLSGKCIKERFENPKVSIIIPIYNVEAYIKECFNSLIEQSLKETEFICIDDESTDRSYEISEEYAKQDARFIVLKQEHKGQGIGRNKCLELAKGEYIAFVDPDDKLEPNALEELYNFAKEKDAQVVQFDYITFGEAAQNVRNSYAEKYLNIFKYDLSIKQAFNWKDLDNENLFTYMDFHIWSRIYKTSFVKENKLQFAPTTNGEDHLFAIGMLLSAKEIYYYDKALYWYRLRRGSSVKTKSDKNFCAFENLKLTETYLKEKKFLPKLQKALSKYKASKLFWHYNQISDESKARYLEETKKYLSKNEYKYFEKLLKGSEYSFWEQIFSLKNKRIEGIKHKYLTILGLKFLLSPKKINME